MRSTVGWGLAIALWAGAVLAGSYELLRYSAAPGPMGKTAARWPEGTHLALSPDRPTLVMFAHPQCACTRASLAELGRMLTRVGPRVAAHVVFMRGTDEAWTQSSTVARARELPNVEVSFDTTDEAARFGAATSGHTTLYAPTGERLFVGGLTASRGHEGYSQGQASLIALIEGPELKDASSATPPPDHTRVFGCELQTPVTVAGGSSP
jgi:hypothetical protein